MSIIGLIGIIIALVGFMFFVFKGYNSLIVGVICCLIVAVTNGLNPVTAFSTTYVSGATDMILTLFVMVFLGAIFGKVFTDTGAAASIANFLLKYLIIKKEGKAQIRWTIISMIILAGLCTLGGIDGYTQYFLFAPLCLIMLEAANIPRRFLPGFLALNTGFIAFPASLQTYNIMMKAAMAQMGYDWGYGGAFFARLIGIIVIIICEYFILLRLVAKAKDKGETFEWGPVQKVDALNRDLPPVILAIIPLVVTFILFMILGLDASISLACGIISDLILMGRYVEKKEGKRKWFTIKNSLNNGADNFPGAIWMLCAPSALAAVVTATDTFSALTAIIATWNINLIVLGVVVTCIVVAITSSPPAALMIAVPLVITAGGANLQPYMIPLIGGTIVLACSTFETLPCNGAVLLGLSMSKTTHKESYFPVFMETVLFTFIGTVICAIICIVAPYLP